MWIEIDIRMDLTDSKLISILSLGLGSIIAGTLPACFARQSRQQWPLFLSSLLCFGGGVLLSTSLTHILPELRESLAKEYRPYAELFFCAGFFALYLIDEIVHYFFGETDITSNSVQVHNHNGHGHGPQNRSYPNGNSKRNDYGTVETNPLVSGNWQLPYNPSFYGAGSDSVPFQDQDATPSQLCHVGHQEPCHAAPTANLGLLVALSVHALLEGLVVGLETLPSKVLLLLGAIASHKLVVGFCLGMELASNAANTICRHFTYIFIFTIGSVGGIIVGMVISNIPNEVTTLTIPILQGLAGGTLLYVTVCEVIPRERARWHQQHNKRAAGVCQFLSVLIGFGAMTALGRYLD